MVFLQDPNQLIRASALRVLSSIRVSMIVPIMLLAIKESVSDMSPYVRKTAAHAIPKLYRSAVSCFVHLVCFMFRVITTLIHMPVFVDISWFIVVSKWFPLHL